MKKLKQKNDTGLYEELFKELAHAYKLGFLDGAMEINKWRGSMSELEVFLDKIAEKTTKQTMKQLKLK